MATQGAVAGIPSTSFREFSIYPNTRILLLASVSVSVSIQVTLDTSHDEVASTGWMSGSEAGMHCTHGFAVPTPVLSPPSVFPFKKNQEYHHRVP